jgi:uncharacterized damage-inducible protein DinB
MTLKELLLAQLEREAVLTRKAVDRVPEGQNSFKPHERSMELGLLSALVASMLGWITVMIDRDEFSLDDPANESFRTRPRTSKAELVAGFDAGIANARRALESTTDEHLQKPWAFKMGNQPVHKDARHIMIADSVFSHLAHHRGQLTVYLRLLESKVPALYGPSADERF